jgi:hypothetical protein
MADGWSSTGLKAVQSRECERDVEVEEWDMTGIRSINRVVYDFLTVNNVDIDKCIKFNQILILYDSQNKNSIKSILCRTTYFMTWTAVKIYKVYHAAL